MKNKKYKKGQLITINNAVYRVMENFTIGYFNHEKPISRLNYTCGKCRIFEQCKRFKKL